MPSIAQLSLLASSLALSALAVPTKSPINALTKREDGGLYCGAVTFAPDSNTQYKEISGNWTIPQISARDGQNPADGPNLPIWVGIDAYNCGTLLQAGTTSSINSDGTQSNDFWVEFFPDAAVFQNFPSNVGDQVSVQVTADSTTTGTAILTNISQNQQRTVPITAPSGSALCFNNAEWIIEYNGVGMAAFNDFSIATQGTTAAGASFNAVGSQNTGVITRNGVEYCNGGPDGNGNVNLSDN